MTTEFDRSTAIRRCLGVARPMGDAAADLALEARTWMESANQLDPAEEARLISECIRMFSGRLVELHGGR